MKFITIGLILMFNLVAIGSMYQALGKVELKNKIAIMALALIGMYAIIYIVYGISSSGGEERIVEASRQLISFTLLPINTLCIMSPIITQIRKIKMKEIDENKFAKKILLYSVIGIIILIIEISYIQQIQAGIASFKHK